MAHFILTSGQSILTYLLFIKRPNGSIDMKRLIFDLKSILRFIGAQLLVTSSEFLAEDLFGDLSLSTRRKEQVISTGIYGANNYTGNTNSNTCTNNKDQRTSFLHFFICCSWSGRSWWWTTVWTPSLVIPGDIVVVFKRWMLRKVWPPPVWCRRWRCLIWWSNGGHNMAITSKYTIIYIVVNIIII